MKQPMIFSAVSALQLLATTEACSFHATSERGEPMNNVRRSSPGNYTRTAIENIRVFNGWKFTVPQTVCLDGGYIVDLYRCIGPVSARVDGTGKFLILGLFDNHWHLTDVQSLETFTSYGCTTAMHMNCRNYTQCDIMAHQPGLATFLHTGMSSVGNGSMHENQDPTRPEDTLIYPDTNVTQFTEWQFNNGSDFHKITAELHGPSTEQQIEMVRVAHEEFQKQTMRHAGDIAAYKQATDSITDGIQHVPDDGLLSNATIRQIKLQSQFITPTINLYRYTFNIPILKEGFLGIQAGSNRTLTHAETNAQMLYKAGVPLIVGIDSIGSQTQNGTTVSIPWGLTVHYEMQNFVEVLGMSPAEALNVATRDAAKWHRVPDRGSVEVGKRADLVILNSNPLDNITNTQDIDRIWVFGVPVSHVTKGYQPRPF